jgi:low affinity Fe/Cu permease
LEAGFARLQDAGPAAPVKKKDRAANQERDMRKFFTVISAKISQVAGTHWAFLVAFSVIIIWAVSGPMFSFSDTWQLIINTGTTIVTFLMVFLIQNTQNRDAKAMHLKLDELIMSVRRARNEMINIETLDDEQLERIAEYYKKKKEECDTDTVQAIAKDVAEDTAKEVAEETTREVMGEAAGEQDRKVA